MISWVREGWKGEGNAYGAEVSDLIASTAEEEINMLIANMDVGNMALSIVFEGSVTFACSSV